MRCFGDALEVHSKDKRVVEAVLDATTMVLLPSEAPTRILAATISVMEMLFDDAAVQLAACRVLLTMVPSVGGDADQMGSQAIAVVSAGGSTAVLAALRRHAGSAPLFE